MAHLIDTVNGLEKGGAGPRSPAYYARFRGRHSFFSIFLSRRLSLCLIWKIPIVDAVAPAKTALQRQEAEQRLELLALKRRLLVRANNRSGMAGVARYEPKGRGPFWLAFWDDDGGIRHNRKFSVRVLGEDEALRRAVQVRLEAEASFRQRLVELKSTF